MKSLLVFAALLLPLHARAEGWICHSNEECQPRGAVSSKSAGPRGGDSIRINPATVPTENVFGVQAIEYKGAFDLSLIKGLGRVGAAISPSNNEETFFGPPGFELPEDKLDRVRAKDKFKSNKLTVAGAFNAYKSSGSGFDSRTLNLGAMVKHNSDTKGTTGGLGLSGTIGFISLGYSIYSDQSQLDYTHYLGLTTKPIVNYWVETYSAGVFLKSVFIDYSVLRMVTDEIATVSVVTGTLLLGRYIFTLAIRTENSDRAVYNPSTNQLENKHDKQAAFLGVQFRLNSFLMLGAFYNYYLVNDLSAGVAMLF